MKVVFEIKHISRKRINVTRYGLAQLSSRCRRNYLTLAFLSCGALEALKESLARRSRRPIMIDILANVLDFVNNIVKSIRLHITWTILLVELES